MIKLVALLATKEGMGRDAYVRRYEDLHVPLIERVVPLAIGYKRSHVLPQDRSDPRSPMSRPFFDTLTECWYPDQEALEAVGALLQGQAGAEVAEDETHLFDRSKMVMFSVEAQSTTSDKLKPRPAGHHGEPDVRLITLLQTKRGITRDALMERYEKQHIALEIAAFGTDGRLDFAKYTRDYLIPGGRFDMSHVGHAPPQLDFDVITARWFWTQQDYQQYLDRRSEAAGRAVIAKEETLFDTSRTVTFTAEEYTSDLPYRDEPLGAA